MVMSEIGEETAVSERKVIIVGRILIRVRLLCKRCYLKLITAIDVRESQWTYYSVMHEPSGDEMIAPKNCRQGWTLSVGMSATRYHDQFTRHAL